MSDAVELPEGQETFKLNEVCKLANVQPYMLRFWGTEFSNLEASKSGTGQRIYDREQVELILEVRRLLFDEGLTIAGARKRLSGGSAPAVKPKKRAPRPRASAAEAEPTAPPSIEPVPSPQSAPVERRPEPSDAAPHAATLQEVRDELAGIVQELRNQ